MISYSKSELLKQGAMSNRLESACSGKDKSQPGPWQPVPGKMAPGVEEMSGRAE